MTISFLHGGSETWASYRYRASRPAAYLGATMNDPKADVVVFSKPMPSDVETARRARADGRIVIVDVCDMHLGRPEYRALGDLAHVVTCPTEEAAGVLRSSWPDKVSVIPDPYEFDECQPHATSAMRLLWFGHGSNYGSLLRVRPQLTGYVVRVMSDVANSIPWSLDGLRYELTKADVVLLPFTAAWKSVNRALEAIRQGCFVVAEPTPPLEHFPGVWQGTIGDGLAWVQSHIDEANARTYAAQDYIRDRFSIERIGEAWRVAIVHASSRLEAQHA